MKPEVYEILFSGGVDAKKWQDFLRAVAKYLRFGNKWQIVTLLDGATLRYYLESPRPLPPSLGVADFLLKKASVLPALQALKPSTPKLFYRGDNSLALMRQLASRERQLQRILVEFRSYSRGFTSSAYLIYSWQGQDCIERLACSDPASLLTADFASNKNFNYKKFPEYLKSDKSLKLLQSDPSQAIFEVDPFPYDEQKQFLGLSAYDFEKHSIVLGGSGSGKSKFLANFIDKIYQSASDKYRIVVIDPHDTLKFDCGQVKDRLVIDFQAVERSINLFQSNLDDINISVELTLELFRSLMSADYNTQLERVLRFASYLLMTTGQFSFLRLRRLLTDLEFCNGTVSKYTDRLPDVVTRFFLADFSELRTKSYSVAIAPIIAFIDEMQMVPVFNRDVKAVNLADNIQNNFLTIYSLSRPKLGQKVVQTISGLLLQQLFLFAQRKLISEHLIIVIDEVATIESPILSRFLSELRKFRTSLVLAGQYFDQLSPGLQEAIFANTANYYIFRVSKRDAGLLANNMKIKLANSDKLEDQQDVLTSLKDRECLIQVNKAGEAYPAFKARTLDFTPVVIPSDDETPSTIAASDKSEELKVEKLLSKSESGPVVLIESSLPELLNPNQPLMSSAKPHEFEFSLDGAATSKDIMSATSTSRKIIKEEHA